MLLLMQWWISYLIVIAGKVFAALFPKEEEQDKPDKEENKTTSNKE